MIAVLKRLLLSRSVWAMMWLLALVATTTASVNINDVIPDNQRLETFGGFRDGTYSALIAICALVFSFVGQIFRERANIAMAKERTVEAKVQAEAMAMLGSDMRSSVDRLEDLVEGLIKRVKE